MTGMEDLIAFLRARLDEREARALAAKSSGGGDWVSMGSLLLRLENGAADPDIAEATNYRYDDVLAHAAENGPDFVLADVDSKRRIIDRAEFVANHGPARDHVRALDMTTGASAALRDVLLLLAQPYADHPDYREEWRP